MAVTDRESSDSESCSFSTVQSVRCTTSQDESGKPVRICENKREVFRHCLGRPSELVESKVETTQEDASRALESRMPLDGFPSSHHSFSGSLPGMLHDWYKSTWHEQRENAPETLIPRQFEEFLNREDGPLQGIWRKGDSVLGGLDDALQSLEGFAEGVFDNFMSKVGKEFGTSSRPKVTPYRNEEERGEDLQDAPRRKIFQRWGWNNKDAADLSRRNEQLKTKDYEDYSKMFQDV